MLIIISLPSPPVEKHSSLLLQTLTHVASPCVPLLAFAQHNGLLFFISQTIILLSSLPPSDIKYLSVRVKQTASILTLCSSCFTITERSSNFQIITIVCKIKLHQILWDKIHELFKIVTIFTILTVMKLLYFILSSIDRDYIF